MSGQSSVKKRKLQATCPACGFDIHFRKQPWRGELVTCPDCDSMLEVTRMAPLELGWAFEEPLENGRDRERTHQENVYDVDYDMDGDVDDDEWEDDDYEADYPEYDD